MPKKVVIPTRTAMPEQPPEVRAHNYEEVTLGYTPEQAKAEAMRCLQCVKPVCIQGCPVNINIPGFLQLVADGDFRGAVNLIKETNVLPAITGRVQTITAPPGTTWKDVSIVLLDSSVQVTIRGRQSDRDYAQAGFRDPDQRLVLLKLFGAARGMLDAEKAASVLDGGSPLKTRISRLRQLLQELIEVDGDPIAHHKKSNTYSCQFEIRLAGDCGYPTPAGATWLDFSFHERNDGRLLVSTTETRRFRARDHRAETGRAASEVAEQGAPIGRIYSVEELGLRTNAGKPVPVVHLPTR